MFNIEIADRLIAVRKALGYTDQRVFAPLVGISWRTLQTYEQGTVKKMPLAYIEALNKQFNVSKDWIYAGQGHMFLEKQSAKFIQNHVVNNGGNPINQAETVHISHGGASATVPTKEAPIESSDMINEDLVFVDYYPDGHASAGGGSPIFYGAEKSVMAFSRMFLQSHFGIKDADNLYIIPATGDSMAETICSGELMFVIPYASEGYKFHDGSIYVFISSDSTFVKRIRRNYPTKTVTLVSDNKSVDDYTISMDELDSFQILGRVIGHFERL